MKNKLLITVVISAIVMLWLTGWYVSLPQGGKRIEALSISEVFDSYNALFTGLAFGGVILTIIIQMQELKQVSDQLSKAAEANVIMASENREKSILDLYQTFTSEYFKETRKRMFRIMSCCVKSKDYCDFVVSRLFVVGTINLDKSIIDQVKGEFNGRDDIEDEIKNDRYSLDDMMNFFHLLTFRKIQKDVVTGCDFFYDWWRPYLWMICDLLEDRYKTIPNIQQFCQKPNLRNVLGEMDRIYGQVPFTDRNKLWKYLLSHPRLLELGLDKKWKSPV